MEDFADDSSWLDSEDGYFEITTRRHHRAESAGNSSNTQSDDGYYGYGWSHEDESEKEDAVIPEPPHFDKLRSPHPIHKHQIQNLPDDFADGGFKDPLKGFQLFINDDTFGELAAATNAYAVKRKPKKIKWSPTSAEEIKVFFGAILYMGICRSQDLEDYWLKKPGWPQYPIGKVISESRFRQLLKFFHIGPPDLDDEDWKGQLEPLGAKIREASMRYYLPGTEMSFNWTKDSNIISLQHYSYTWNFLFYNDTPNDLETEDLEIQGMSFPVSTNAYQLATSLPKETRQFIIHAKKDFTSVPLFSALRKIGIGAIGEATWKHHGFPKSLQELKGKYIPWNTVTGALAGPDNDVLAIVWRHFATCIMMTTVHEIIPHNNDNYGKSEAYKNPAPPKDEPLINAAFGKNKKAMIDQPRVALDHSDYSECKQHLFLKRPREMFSARQLGKEPVVQARKWIMGLMWLLDIAVVNANVIAKVYGGKATHDSFRMDVASGLMNLKEAVSQDGEPSKKKARVF